MNLRNTFKEYQDPKVFRYLKIGFAALVVLGVLLLFTLSPGARHLIGIGGGHAVEQGPTVTHKQPRTPPQHHKRQVHIKGKTGHHRVQKRKSQGHHGHSHPSVTHHTEGSTPVLPVSHEHTHHPKHHEESGSNGNPGTPNQPPPGSPPSSQPSPPTEPSGGSGGTHESNPGGGAHEESKPPVKVEVEGTKPPVKVEVTPPKVEVTPPKVGVEINVPPVTNSPPVEEITETVNETVHGVTGVVEETVNGTGLPIHVEVPEVCLVHC